MNYEDAEKDYINGMKYKQIAEKYGVSLNTVKSWKTRYNWIRGSDAIIHRDNTKKGVHTKIKKVCTQIDEDEQDENGLTERQRIFATLFVKNHNATRAYMKAYGTKYECAAVRAHELLKNIKIQEYVQNLHDEQLKYMSINEDDVLQRYVDIIYADPLDYVDPETGMPRKDIEEGNVLQGIVQTRTGPQANLPDKIKALTQLQKYFERKAIVLEKKADAAVESNDNGVIVLAEVEQCQT